MKRPDWLERITGLCYQVGDCRDIQLLLAHCDELREALGSVTRCQESYLCTYCDNEVTALLNRTEPPTLG